MSDYEDCMRILVNQYPVVDGYDFYMDLFPDCEKVGEQHTNYKKPNALYLYYDADRKRLRRRIMLKDAWAEDYANYVEGSDFALCSGLIYRGWKNALAKAQRMSALIFDLDGVGEQELSNLETMWELPPEKYGAIPKPTYICLSGSGLHLYYVFERPIDLYPNIKLQLKGMKYDLTAVIWRYGETSKVKSIQRQSINQTFRMVGSYNNKDDKHEIVAFRNGEKVTIDYLNMYVLDARNKVDLQKPFKATKRSLREAKESFPEWYERVIVKGEKKVKRWEIENKVHGKDPYALYHWWLKRENKNQIVGGHRYFYLMCMAIYACKCNYPKKQLIKDMKEIFNEMAAIKHTNELTKEDMKAALETYDKEYYDTRIDEIVYWTDVKIEKNKRNGRTQKRHLEIARADKQDMKERGVPFKGKYGKEGRPSKREEVLYYKSKLPNATQTEIADLLHISRATVNKWWKS